MFVSHVAHRDPCAVRKLTCQEVLDHLEEYLDEEAKAELRAQVDLHTGECPHCRIEIDSLKRTILIYKKDERVFLPQTLSAKLASALQQAYQSGTCDECGGKDKPTEA